MKISRCRRKLTNKITRKDKNGDDEKEVSIAANNRYSH